MTLEGDHGAAMLPQISARSPDSARKIGYRQVIDTVTRTAVAELSSTPLAGIGFGESAGNDTPRAASPRGRAARLAVVSC